jgi:hypothetical protein
MNLLKRILKRQNSYIVFFRTGKSGEGWIENVIYERYRIIGKINMESLTFFVRESLIKKYGVPKNTKVTITNIIDSKKI